jgi:hypothetical protein
VHFVIAEDLTDEHWRDLIVGVKRDYQRVSEEKTAVLKSLEKWFIFSNKFIQVSEACEHLHSRIHRHTNGFEVYKSSSRDSRRHFHKLRALTRRSASLYTGCLELSLLTPVLAETFINMLILILCKPDVRQNARQLESFIRSQIDAKIFDLPYKCEGFTDLIDQNSPQYKNFKRVMDKRNKAIHGNVDPEKEQIEVVYFEGTRPLYKEPGDHIGKLLETMERQNDAPGVIKDYEDTYEFLCFLVNRLQAELRNNVWRILEDRYPGYDADRKICGGVLPDRIILSVMEGARYDDELNVKWRS